MSRSPTSHPLKAHAKERMQQRGIRRGQLELLMRHADLVVPVHRQLRALRVSRRELSSLLAEGWPPSRVERIAKLVAIESTRDGSVVTVAHMHGRRSRRYRRRCRRFSVQGRRP